MNNTGIDPEGDKIFKSGSAKTNNVRMDPSVESQVMETNVIGVVRSTKAFLPFLAKGGAIVSIGSYM